MERKGLLLENRTVEYPLVCLLVIYNRLHHLCCNSANTIG